MLQINTNEQIRIIDNVWLWGSFRGQLWFRAYHSGISLSFLDEGYSAWEGQVTRKRRIHSSLAIRIDERLVALCTQAPFYVLLSNGLIERAQRTQVGRQVRNSLVRVKLSLAHSVFWTATLMVSGHTQVPIHCHPSFSTALDWCVCCSLTAWVQLLLQNRVFPGV